MTFPKAPGRFVLTRESSHRVSWTPTTTGLEGGTSWKRQRESLDVVCRTLARFGTTSYYPTTLTAPEADIRRALELLADYIKESETRPRPMAQPLGIHMEGPYLSAARRGLHPAEHLVEPTLDAYRELAQAAAGQLRIVTLAPELARGFGAD